MELISDKTRANRLARVIADNIEQYNPALVKKGILEETIFDLLHDQIEEGRNEFNSRVVQEFAESKMFDYALVDVLIKRAYKHNSPA